MMSADQVAEDLMCMFALLGGDPTFTPHDGWRRRLATLGEWLYWKGAPSWLVDACVDVSCTMDLERIASRPPTYEQIRNWMAEAKRMSDELYAEIEQGNEKQGGE